MKITVGMTETADYRHEFELDEFATMVLEGGRTEGESDADLLARLKALVEAEPSEDYGVADCDNLLDKMLESGFVAVSDRSWGFGWPNEEGDRA